MMSIISRLAITALMLFSLSLFLPMSSVHATASAQEFSLDDLPFVVALDETNPIDEVMGSGTTEKIKGKAKQDLGTVEKNLGKIQGKTQEMKKQMTGTVKEIQGQAKQNTGELKNRLDEASSEAEEASENLLDSVKSLFGK